MAKLNIHCILWSDDLIQLSKEISHGREATQEEAKFMAESIAWLDISTQL